MMQISSLEAYVRKIAMHIVSGNSRSETIAAHIPVLTASMAAGTNSGGTTKPPTAQIPAMTADALPIALCPSMSSLSLTLPLLMRLDSSSCVWRS